MQNHIYDIIHNTYDILCDYDQPVPKAYRKYCVKFPTTPSVRTGFPAVIQHSLSEHLKCLQAKTWNNLSSANLFFWRAQNALCSKTGGAIIGLWVSKQDVMIFSSSPTCLSLVRVNPPILTQFWCRNHKIWGKRIPSLKSKGKWKSQIMDGVCWIMISNQPTDVMWQNGHISPQQNHALMKILSKKCLALGLHS